MKKMHIVTYNLFDNFDVGRFHNFLNASPEILNWLAPALPGVVIVVSRLNLDGVTALIGGHMDGRSYMVAEADAHNVNGWLPQDVWSFISNTPEAPPLKQIVTAQPSRAAHAGLAAAGLDGNRLAVS